MVKHDKLDHVLDTIIWDFWAESVQCGMEGKAEMSEIAREFLMMSTVTITTTYLLTIGGILV